MGHKNEGKLGYGYAPTLTEPVLVQSVDVSIQVGQTFLSTYESITFSGLYLDPECNIPLLVMPENDVTIYAKP